MDPLKKAPPPPQPEEEAVPKGESLPPAKPPPAPMEEEDEPPESALFLPMSTKDIVVEPPARRAAPAENAAPKPERRPAQKEPPPRTEGGPKHARQSVVQLAALAGGALGLLSIGVIFVMLRSEPQSAAPPTGASPFGKREAEDAIVTSSSDELATQPAPPAPEAVSPVPVAAPVPIAPPAPVAAPTPSRPTATFSMLAKPKAPAPSAKPKPAVADAPPSPPKPEGPQWTFEGTVYDLLTTNGVFGVKLMFVDAEDKKIASVETGSEGRFKVTLPAGPVGGYQLRIIHDNYSGKHIDELDSTSSVRNADLEQRKFLLQAGARSLPWVGTEGKSVRRDMALVPVEE
jgi:hypothetical protein